MVVNLQEGLAEKRPSLPLYKIRAVFADAIESKELEYGPYHSIKTLPDAAAERTQKMSLLDARLSTTDSNRENINEDQDLEELNRTWWS